MSRLRKGAVPTYRLHKARRCAVVTIDGRHHYLGRFGTPSSRQKYAALIRAWQQRQEEQAAGLPVPDEPLRPNHRPTVNEVILAYVQHAAAYYKPNHGENKEAGCVSDALKVLQEEGYGRDPADSFRPKDLKKVREAMVAKKWSRNYVNAQVNPHCRAAPPARRTSAPGRWMFAVGGTSAVPQPRSVALLLSTVATLRSKAR